MRHELHLTLRGMRALAFVLPVVVGAGVAVGGRAGLASALAGAGLVAGNQMAAAASTAWSRTLSAGAMAAGYGFFVVRMFGVLAAFVAAAGASWVHRPLLAASFCAALAVTLGAECLAYARGSYVPSWRIR